VAQRCAVGVEAAGRTLRARRAVLASVTPSALYGRLLPEGAVDSALRAEAALWLQLQEVPYAPRGDAAGELDTTHGWTEALAKGYANRVLDRVARHAPDLRDKIRAIDVLTPDDLCARNPNAVKGGRRERTLKLASQLRVQLLERSKVFCCIGFSSHPRKELRAILIGLGHLWFELDRLVVMFKRL
jgi:phytoene dehydrogenase-like protein